MARDEIADFMRGQDTLPVNPGQSEFPVSPDEATRHAELKDFLDAPSQPLDLNKLGADGYSPLHIAVLFLRVRCAELLLARGAKSEVISKNGLTPTTLFSLMWSGSTTKLAKFDIFEYYRYDGVRATQMYEVFEFNLLMTRFPDETLGLVSFVLNQDSKCVLDASKSGSTEDLESLMTHEELFKDELGKRLTWIQVDSTNGIILQKILCLIERYHPKRMGGRESINSFYRLYQTMHTNPRNGLLRYKEPSYEVDFQESEGQLRKYAYIIFPCLALSTVHAHKKRRSKMKDMDSLRVTTSQAQYLLFSNKIFTEQTLDESYYPRLDSASLETRNAKQVVSESFRSTSNGDEKYIPILIVPQLWLWRLDKDVVSAYAKDHNGMDTAINTLSPDLLMGRIIASHVFDFGRTYRSSGRMFGSILDIFETAMLFNLSDVDFYLGSQNSVLAFHTEVEQAFIQIMTNIRSEVVMINDVFDQQEKILDSLLDDPTRDSPGDDGWQTVKEAKKTLAQYRRRIAKLDRDAERIERSIQDKLNLKRTNVNFQVARASIKEARDSKILSLLIIGFTIVTIIFTPLSFMCGLFALNIDTFNNIKSDTQVFSGQKITGIFLGVEILTIGLTAAIGLCLTPLFLRVLNKQDPQSEPETRKSLSIHDKLAGTNLEQLAGKIPDTGAPFQAEKPPVNINNQPVKEAYGLFKKGISFRHRSKGREGDIENKVAT